MFLPCLDLEVRRSTDEMEGPIMSSTGDTWGWLFTTRIVWIAAAATLLTHGGRVPQPQTNDARLGIQLRSIKKTIR